MQKTYTCKYCGKQWDSNVKRNGHQGMCKLNPNHSERINNISETLKKKAIGNSKPKLEYKIQCVQCGKETTVILTENAFLKQRYSRRCESCKPVVWNKGKTKLTNASLKKKGETYHNRCLEGKIIPSQLGKPLSEQHKKKVSEGMKRAHKEGRAWNIGMSRWNSEMSYPQKFFTMVIANQFEDKNYKHQYPVGKYSLDFAWVDKKKCIQIDGQQHLKEDAIQHDRIRDQYLVAQDWDILRISWKQMCNDFKGTIKIAKQFIDF